MEGFRRKATNARQSLAADTVDMAQNAVWKLNLYLSINKLTIMKSKTKNNSRLRWAAPIKNIYLGQGTAFFISPTQIITNFHVINKLNSQVTMMLVKDEGEGDIIKIIRDVRVIKVSAQDDLALLEVKDNNSSYLDLNKDTKDIFKNNSTEKHSLLGYRKGNFEKIALFVPPYNEEYGRFAGLMYDSSIDSSIDSMGGVSGGPVINQQGAVVGVASSVFIPGEPLPESEMPYHHRRLLLIPADILKNFLNTKGNDIEIIGNGYNLSQEELIKRNEESKNQNKEYLKRYVYMNKFSNVSNDGKFPEELFLKYEQEIKKFITLDKRLKQLLIDIETFLDKQDFENLLKSEEQLRLIGQEHEKAIDYIFESLDALYATGYTFFK